MINLSAAAVVGPGFGESFTLVHINKGNDIGWHVYTSKEVDKYVGVDIGVSLVYGGIKFNYASGQDLNRGTFEGVTYSYNGSMGSFSVSYVVSYSDGKFHLPGTGPVLYSGVLDGANYGSSWELIFGGSVGYSNSTGVWSNKLLK